MQPAGHRVANETRWSANKIDDGEKKEKQDEWSEFFLQMKLSIIKDDGDDDDDTVYGNNSNNGGIQRQNEVDLMFYKWNEMKCK